MAVDKFYNSILNPTGNNFYEGHDLDVLSDDIKEKYEPFLKHSDNYQTCKKHYNDLKNLLKNASYNNRLIHYLGNSNRTKFFQVLNKHYDAITSDNSFSKNFLACLIVLAHQYGYGTEQNLQTAIAVAEENLKLFKFPPLMRILGEIWLQSELTREQGFNLLEEAYQIEPDSSLCFLLVDHYTVHKNYEKSVHYYEILLEEGHNRVLPNLLRTSVDNKMFVDTEKYFKKMLNALDNDENFIEKFESLLGFFKSRREIFYNYINIEESAIPEAFNTFCKKRNLILIKTQDTAIAKSALSNNGIFSSHCNKGTKDTQENLACSNCPIL